MKVALIHDHLAQDGGAEKTLKVLAEIFPEAPIYTLLGSPKNIEENYANRRIETSIIQKLPGGIKHYQWYMPFMPMAVEFFDLTDFDLVLSDTSSFAKGVITAPDTLHICYCHTATRYLWSDTHQYIKELKYNKYFKKIISLVLNYVRLWDKMAADRVDVYVTNSKTSQQRIKKYYRRDAAIIYPPVETEKFYISDKQEDYFLAGCRLVPYKRIDNIISAFKESGLKLKIFGDGIDKERLRAIADGAPNIEFLDRVSDETRSELYSKCQAYINPQKEDFGITVVEAMASGRPVIALRAGGAVETVISGQTGVFIESDSPQAIAEAVKNFDSSKFNPAEIRNHASQFSVDNFKGKIKCFIEEEYQNFKDGNL
ncbi:MAG: Glycosyltransferase Gtf1 [Parcubacteria group bacterium ADurb.Bin316]|nr:MAG: Glycosyltransferase Gtf1 [Parcubacteria group bacterium ADurb.Bin316]HOZ56297.1 glycosyltransferase [bacterium]